MNKYNRIFVALGIFIIQLIIIKILFSATDIVDFIVNKIIFPINRFVSRFTSLVDFPLGELFYLLIIFFLIRLLFLLIKNFIKGDKLKCKKTIFNLLLFTNIIYFIYMFSWGIMYTKKTLDFEREALYIDSNILKKIYCSELEKATETRSFIRNGNSKDTLKFQSSLQDFNQEFDQLQYNLRNLKWLKNYRFLKSPTYKLSNISLLQNYLGILGYYNPFTIESNLNKYNTSLKQPFTLFHEYAHQMGFASESEANFIAYYLGINSKNIETNYAAFYKSTFSLLGAIYNSDPYFVKNEIDNMNYMIKRDREAEIKFYEKYDGKSSEVFSELNNQFLKANNQEGTITYSKYVELIYKLYTK